MRRLAAWIAAAALILLVASSRRRRRPPTGPRTSERARPQDPAPPRLPANFRARGRWVVRSLGITVPVHLAQRERQQPDGRRGQALPDLVCEPDLPQPALHAHLQVARGRRPPLRPGPGLLHPEHAQRGPARIAVRRPRGPAGQTRTAASTTGGSASSCPRLPPGNHLRFPIALADVYVGQGNRSRWWQLLQFGFQNLLDPELDEWGMLDRFRLEPAPVSLPNRCPPPSTPT